MQQAHSKLGRSVLHATPAECAPRPVQDTCAVRKAAGAGQGQGASKERAWVRFAHESCKLIYGPFVSPCRHAADPTYCPTLGAYYPYDNDKKFLCSHTCSTQSDPYRERTYIIIIIMAARTVNVHQYIHSLSTHFGAKNIFSTFALRGRRMSMEKKKYCRFC